MADIKTWQERGPHHEACDVQEAMQQEIAELRAALANYMRQSNRQIDIITLNDQRTKEAMAALPEVIKAVRTAVEINDGDTLSSLTPDNYPIWVASGSWNGSAAVTLGHLRTIASAANPLLMPYVAASAAPQQPAQDKPAALTREQIAKVAGGSMEPSRYHFFMAKIDSAMRAAPDTGGTG